MCFLIEFPSDLKKKKKKTLPWLLVGKIFLLVNISSEIDSDTKWLMLMYLVTLHFLLVQKMVSKGWDIPLASPGVPVAGMLSVTWEGRGIQLTVFGL